MHPISLLNKTPYRLALLYSAVFFVAFLLAATLAFRYIQHHLVTRLDQQLLDKYTSVVQQSSIENTHSVITTINTHVRVFNNDDHIYLLRSNDGTTIAGNVTISKKLSGYATLLGTELGQNTTTRYRVYANSISGLNLWVGISDKDTVRIQQVVFESIAVASILALFITLGGAAWLAHHSQQRVSAVGLAMRAIADGNLDTRLAVSSRKDDIDNISIEINATLDRLQLMIVALDDTSINIAHDLKTPINRLFMEIDKALEKARNNLDVEQDLIAAHEELSAINITSDALLRLASIKQNTKKTNFDTVDLHSVVDNVYGVYAPVYEDQRMSLELINRYDSPLVVYADQNLLTQLFVNLLENALRYCPIDSQVRMILGTCDERAYVSVTDEGPGIPDAEKENVFRRLYRMDKSRTTQGAGMGLSLVEAIVQLHDATIELTDNNPGLIVTVSFALSK